MFTYIFRIKNNECLVIVFNHFLRISFLLFSRVIDGWETLDELEKQPVKEKNFKPLNEIRLKTITIHANPIADET